MRLRALEELARCQIERDIRLAVGVDQDDVVLSGLGRHPVAAIGDGDVQIRLVHVEVPPADVDDLGVDFDAVDGHGSVDRGELPGDRAAGKADQGDPAGSVARAEVGGQQGIVPIAVGIQTRGVVDRMHGRSFVQQQLGLVARANDLDVVVGRLGFIEALTVGRPPDRAA